MKKLGKDLEFISRILRDGTGVNDMKGVDLIYINEETFELHALSLTKETYIAIGFHIYIVKLK